MFESIIGMLGSRGELTWQGGASRSHDIAIGGVLGEEVIIRETLVKGIGEDGIIGDGGDDHDGGWLGATLMMPLQGLTFSRRSAKAVTSVLCKTQPKRIYHEDSRMLPPSGGRCVGPAFPQLPAGRPSPPALDHRLLPCLALLCATRTDHAARSPDQTHHPNQTVALASDTFLGRTRALFCSRTARKTTKSIFHLIMADV
jgi:hypothetical protein